MSQPRKSPYIWVTWLTKLLVGEAQCEWAAWIKAHNFFDKRPSDFDLTSWQIEHTALLGATRKDLEGEEYKVSIEGENSFEWIGKTARLAGKPDIIALREDESLIIDTKTGKPRVSDCAQVMIYMWAIPYAIPKYKNTKFKGMGRTPMSVSSAGSQPAA